MSGVKGFRTGGTIHFVINNQIRFTTSPAYARSSPYPSDVALMVQAPIFHVNGDDPEAVVHCARIATEFRQLLHKDVVIDMFCYRRFGHNETDEPSFTQPLMYRAIKAQPTTLELYAANLIAEGGASEETWRLIGPSKAIGRRGQRMENHRPNRADWLDGRWSGFAAAPEGDRRGQTAVPLETLKQIGRALTTITEGFHAHRTIVRQLQAKAEMFGSGAGFDWATGEALAFGTLLDEGYPVRLSGRDTARGTFSQRHSVLVDQEDDRYVPLNHIREGQAEFEVINSLLSEFAVLGFEYGYCWRSRRARSLGSTIRRFRQRRADDHRPVHRVGQNEMAQDVRARDAFCRMAMKVRDRNIPLRGWSVISGFARRTTSRSPIARRPRIFTCCAGMRRPSASRSS